MHNILSINVKAQMTFLLGGSETSYCRHLVLQGKKLGYRLVLFVLYAVGFEMLSSVVIYEVGRVGSFAEDVGRKAWGGDWEFCGGCWEEGEGVEKAGTIRKEVSRYRKRKRHINCKIFAIYFTLL